MCVCSGFMGGQTTESGKSSSILTGLDNFQTHSMQKESLFDMLEVNKRERRDSGTPEPPSSIEGHIVVEMTEGIRRIQSTLDNRVPTIPTPDRKRESECDDAKCRLVSLLTQILISASELSSSQHQQEEESKS